MKETKKCPKCGHKIAGYPAISREDNKTEICSECGMKEAIEAWKKARKEEENENGEYETDFIPCILWSGIAEQTTEFCIKGDIVGVKGRIQSREGKIEVVAEKVTFLSSKKKGEEE